MGLLLREPSPSTVGDDEPETGYPWQMGALVFGRQSALYGRAGRGRICPPAGLRGRLARCDMVVGLCLGPREADQSLVAPVCLGCHGAAGGREPGNTAVVARGPARQRLAASGRIASPGPL